MTTLQADPASHYLNVPVTTPRLPLRQEMFTALNTALDTPEAATHRRAYWTGVANGYGVAFGIVTRDALTKARLMPGAVVLSEFDAWKPAWHADEETAWACGVLYGYWQGVAELDCTECAHCGQRLVHDLDDIDSCHHGDFCEDHIDDWHHGGPSAQGDVCSYEDDRWTP